MIQNAHTHIEYFWAIAVMTASLSSLSQINCQFGISRWMLNHHANGFGYITYFFCDGRVSNMTPIWFIPTMRNVWAGVRVCDHINWKLAPNQRCMSYKLIYVIRVVSSLCGRVVKVFTPSINIKIRWTSSQHYANFFFVNFNIVLFIYLFISHFLCVWMVPEDCRQLVAYHRRSGHSLRTQQSYRPGIQWSSNKWNWYERARMLRLSKMLMWMALPSMYARAR